MKPRKHNPFSSGRHFHFIGCGGAGMNPLTVIIRQKGFPVSGSDLECGYSVKLLGQLGIPVAIGHSSGNLPETESPGVAVYSSAVKPDNPELAEAEKRDWQCLRRGELLAELAGQYLRPVAVSGSHGKTTVTAMLAHILKSAGLDPGCMVGGKVTGWNFSGAAGNGDIFVTEADESDGSHRLLSCFLGIVTNVEDDHCWGLGGPEQLYKNFSEFAAKSDKLIYFDSPLTRKLFAEHPDAYVLTINEIEKMRLRRKFPVDAPVNSGNFQRINAALAIKAAEILEVSPETAIKALADFPGVDRRMTVHFQSDDYVVIEDYAHHPTEVQAAIEAIREKFPEKALTVIFQPHRYARLKRYLNGFAEELSKTDQVFIAPVFSAWVETGEIGSGNLADKIGKKAQFLDMPWPGIARKVVEKVIPPAVIAVFGAGDSRELPPEIVRLIANSHQFPA